MIPEPGFYKIDLEKLRDEMHTYFLEKSRNMKAEDILPFSEGLQAMFKIISSEVEFQEQLKLKGVYELQNGGC